MKRSEKMKINETKKSCRGESEIQMQVVQSISVFKRLLRKIMVYINLHLDRIHHR